MIVLPVKSFDKAKSFITQLSSPHQTGAPKNIYSDSSTSSKFTLLSSVK